jgi:Ca-activated chloride channel homolog
MRSHLQLVVSSVLVLVAAGVAAQQPTFRSGSNTVAVYATVTQEKGRLVTDLTQEDFEIFDSGKAQPITVFSTEVQPISVVVMLDRSGSQQGNFRLVEAAVSEFIQRLGPADKARIGSFASQIKIDPENFTADKQQLLNVLRTELQEVGPSPLWNAVDKSITALQEQEGRRVVLVFTDGGDNPQNLKFTNQNVMSVTNRAQAENVMIYAIGLQSTMVGNSRPTIGGGGLGGGFGGGMLGDRPDPGLPAIAGDTGGGYFELTRSEELGSTFARVADELHHQYALGFTPAKLDGKSHKLELKVKKPGMKTRARKSYVAPKG